MTINDNTYRANKASDWGRQTHKLIGSGGTSLEGSDKWDMRLPTSGGDIELKLDYIANSSGVFDTKIDRFKQGVDLDTGLIVFESSLSYNYEVLGLTQFFSGTDEDIASPATSDGMHDFLAPAQAWVGEIQYEFEIQKSAYTGDFDLTAFISALGTLHMSPNKLGSNKVFPIDDPTPMVQPAPPMPEPGTLLVFGLGLAGLGFLRRGLRAV